MNTSRSSSTLYSPALTIAIGLNYHDHAQETGVEIPEKRIVFKYPNTISGAVNSIPVPKITEQADYEAELAVVIGRKAQHVEAEDALDYVFGYMNANDVSFRSSPATCPACFPLSREHKS